MNLVIPKFPSQARFSIDKLWNGDVCLDERLHATVSLSTNKTGLLITTEAPVLENQRIPEAPTGTRVDNLWTFDVVEVFLVGPGHRYLEVELGAGGHFLILGFDSIRNKSNDYLDVYPTLHFSITEKKTWVSKIEIPWVITPENVRAMNAFVIASGQFLALTPVPGEEPDFHQPDFFAQVSMG